ncbi:NAD(+) kinase [Buchnera aphidicola]|uniref:NAD kinase n=1 Tax=Buchnera aphidicola (Sarucallis kahawaluokalani) TaxID=1241878 RepID=A0A4D6Y7N2_9GAMM|nr:NAD(+) kinase [Buchnera aphidicola]QCI25936.1 NAD(+) kinase [Buchnera aphidicola (Sarucallis kahawaluokalani)]
MKIQFRWIAILGHPRNLKFFMTHKILYDWLTQKGYHVVIEKSIAKFLNINNPKIATFIQIGEKCDLGIVIGGDGNMLCILRELSYYPIKIIGINCGNLGFLTDLQPNNMIFMLSKILSGLYNVEKRFLLEVKVLNEQIERNCIAVNEVVLHAEKMSCMVEFEVYIDKKFAFYQRSDGIIISTPTGSTGYALSAGGPILSLSSRVITIVPMLPHTLSARPIVINENDVIMLKLFHLDKKFQISCDGQIQLPIIKAKKIFIYKSKNFVNLIHPISYHYLDTLRKKLNWSKNFF